MSTNPATAEWITKAEGDFATAGRELRARKSPNYDAVCFHTQQCAEKYLKAVLQENERHIPKIHNLIELMLLCEKIDSSFEMLRSDLVVMELNDMFGHKTVLRFTDMQRNPKIAEKQFRFTPPKGADVLTE